MTPTDESMKEDTELAAESKSPDDMDATNIGQSELDAETYEKGFLISNLFLYFFSPNMLAAKIGGSFSN